MDEKLRKKVFDLAAKVRREIEKRDSLTGWPSRDLCGYCGIASARLSQVFKIEKIPHVIAMRNTVMVSHVYLIVEDHVVDITATQFSEFTGQRIVILHSKEAEVHYFYGADKQFKSAIELRKHQLRTGWPEEQVADAL